MNQILKALKNWSMTRLEPPKTKPVSLPDNITLNIDGKEQTLTVGSLVEVVWYKEPWWSAEKEIEICKTLGYAVDVEYKNQTSFIGEQQKPSQHFVFARNILPRRGLQPERWTGGDTLDTRQIKSINELK